MPVPNKLTCNQHPQYSCYTIYKLPDNAYTSNIIFLIQFTNLAVLMQADVVYSNLGGKHM